MDRYKIKELYDQIKKIGVSHVYKDISLADKSWFKIGGPADLFVEPETHDQILRLITLLSQSQSPYLVVGTGSNLLFDDTGYRGVIIHIGHRFSKLDIKGNNIYIEAGAWVPQVARKAGQSGLTGIEHIVGIPGTMGGLVVMNGGSLRKGIGTHVVKLQGVDFNGESFEISQEECLFKYRSSALQEKKVVITKIQLELDTGEKSKIRRQMIEIMANRRKKFPKNFPNCGSVFLSNPIMYNKIGPPGKAIQDVGLLGKRAGNAQIAPMHGNFIINLGDATSEDVLSLINGMRQGVYDATGYIINCEVRHVRPDGSIVPAHETSDALYGFSPKNPHQVVNK